MIKLQSEKVYRTRTSKQVVKSSGDEFYTKYEDVERELKYYWKELKDKIIFCPCDDPQKSQFIKYLQKYKEQIGYKKLTYNWLRQPIEYEFGKLYPKGDFRGEESINLLKECDVVITNPPFSLVEPLCRLIYQYNKQFLIIMSNLAPVRNFIFKKIKNREMWWGAKCKSDIKMRKFYGVNGEIKIAYGLWYTNIKIKEQEMYREKTTLYKDTNFEMINGILFIPDSRYIPIDYKGEMAISVSSLHRHNLDKIQLLRLEKNLGNGKFVRAICKNNT